MRNSYQMPLMDIDRLVKLGEVETILGRIFMPRPSRPTIVAWIEEGLLEGKQIGGGSNWYVFSSSLDKLIRSCQQQSQQKMAA
jgi:hypothetical protein